MHAYSLRRAPTGEISTDRLLHLRVQRLTLTAKSRRGKPGRAGTSPHMLARLLNNTYYPDLPDLAMEIAAVLRRQLELVEADAVQLDEASIAGFPQDTRWAAQAINHVLDGILSEKAVHICFGNYGGQPMLTGFWRDDAPSKHRTASLLKASPKGEGFQPSPSGTLKNAATPASPSRR